MDSNRNRNLADCYVIYAGNLYWRQSGEEVIMDDYPTNEQLKTIKEWDTINRGVKELILYLQDIWWMPDWGFKIIDIRKGEFELHTGGWSGNESIIGVLQDNTMFWLMYWSMSKRGGHYWFISLNVEAKEEKADG